MFSFRRLWFGGVPLVLPLGLSVVRHFNLSGQAKRACTLTTNGPRKPHKLFLKRDENHEISESYRERERERERQTDRQRQRDG